MVVTNFLPQIEARISKWPNITDQQSIDECIARNRASGARYLLHATRTYKTKSNAESPAS